MELREIVKNLFKRIPFWLWGLLRGMLSPLDLGAIGLVEQRGRFVLVRQSYRPGWYLPGGGVGRNEPPAMAIMRELREELGLTRSAPPELIGIFVRKTWLYTNINVLYRVRDAEFDFKPNMEVREILLADPASPPPGTAAGARRRFAEIAGRAPQSPYW